MLPIEKLRTEKHN